jgi:hypothetical protein
MRMSATSVPVDVIVGQIISYQNPYSEISLPCYIDSLSSVTVCLADDDNIELSLPSNASDDVVCDPSPVPALEHSSVELRTQTG